MNRLRSAKLNAPNARLLCVDTSKPGNSTGVALFEGPELLLCWLHTEITIDVSLWGVDVLFVEFPRIRPGDGIAVCNDLLQLARCGGQWEQAFKDAELHHRDAPGWKGQTPWEIHNRRVLAALTPKEREQIECLELPDSKAHNVIDAVGMGLWVYGRIK